MALDKAQFWERKVLAWERRRYSPALPAPGISLEAAARSFRGNSVEFRMVAATEILLPLVPGARVLDLGCGSGRFLRRLEAGNPRGLLGIDCSQSAIAEARSHAPDRTELFGYTCGDVLALNFPDADFVTGLGLLDWLRPPEIHSLLRKIRGRRFLFSFSERRRPLLRGLHYAFVMASYGWKTAGYVPAYYDADPLTSLFGEHFEGRLHFFRHEKLSFSTFVANFPLRNPPVSRRDAKH